jgi:hypothetical protein
MGRLLPILIGLTIALSAFSSGVARDTVASVSEEQQSALCSSALRTAEQKYRIPRACDSESGKWSARNGGQNARYEANRSPGYVKRVERQHSQAVRRHAQAMQRLDQIMRHCGERPW